MSFICTEGICKMIVSMTRLAELRILNKFMVCLIPLTALECFLFHRKLLQLPQLYCFIFNPLWLVRKKSSHTFPLLVYVYAFGSEVILQQRPPLSHSNMMVTSSQCDTTFCKSTAGMVPSYLEHHLAKNPFLTFYLLQSSVSYWNKNKVQPSAECVQGATINSKRKIKG